MELDDEVRRRAAEQEDLRRNVAEADRARDEALSSAALEAARWLQARSANFDGVAFSTRRTRLGHAKFLDRAIFGWMLVRPEQFGDGRLLTVDGQLIEVASISTYGLIPWNHGVGLSSFALIRVPPGSFYAYYLRARSRRRFKKWSMDKQWGEDRGPALRLGPWRNHLSPDQIHSGMAGLLVEWAERNGITP